MALYGLGCLKTVQNPRIDPWVHPGVNSQVGGRAIHVSGASLCTYYRWFDRPRALRWPGHLLMQPLSARCMRILLRFRLGAHSLPVVMGRRTGTPRAQRLCQQCDQHAALFTNGACTMQQFMWHSWTSLVLLTLLLDCFDVLDDIPSNQP